MQGATDLTLLSGEVGSIKAALQSMGQMVTESQEGMLLLTGLVGGASSTASSPVAAPGVTLEDFAKFKANVAHNNATIRQDMKGGGIEMGATVFGNSDDCIQWARVHLPSAFVYQVIPSLTYGLCLQTGEVITKEEMQADEVHAERTKRSPMN